jgi:hypothetical protein
MRSWALLRNDPVEELSPKEELGPIEDLGFVEDLSPAGPY